MEIVLVLLAIGVVWWVVSSRRNEQEQREVRRQDMTVWELEESHPPFLTVWRVQFPTMRMVVTFEATDHPEDEHAPTEYIVKRGKNGWRMKLTDDSHRAALAQAREAATTAAGRAFGGDRLRELEAGNEWVPMPDERFAGLDTAYERYVRQG